jgi:hypothetical protein|tara:strand:- start:684 stop:827 length:144 start_codon:yes stop_codon:yes gene_type:complete
MARQAQQQACKVIQHPFTKVDYPTALVQHIIKIKFSGIFKPAFGSLN